MGIYQNCYNLIMQYIYGGVTSSDIELVCTLFATIFSFCAFALPVIIVYWFAKFILRGFY